MNSYLKKSILTIVNTIDLVFFSNEITTAGKEMRWLFSSVYEKEEKEVASIRSEVLMDKFQEILLYNNIDVFSIRF